MNDSVAESLTNKPGVLEELRGLGSFGQLWTSSVIIFCIVRAVVVWPTLVKYNVNPWWFLALDVGTAPTYGLGQVMGVKILRDKTRKVSDALPWICMVFISFVAPYAYVLASAGKLPSYVVVGVLLWLLVFGLLGAWRIIKEVRAPERV
jgi:hypothetical protein